MAPKKTKPRKPPPPPAESYRQRVQLTGYTCGCSVVVLPNGESFSNSTAVPRA